MEERSFTNWLQRELSTAQYSLLSLYEHHDKLIFVDGPDLERDYMEKVGNYEQTVIAEEIEVELLQKKHQMIQTAINRRELVDLAAIDAEIDRMRKNMLKEAAGTNPAETAVNLTDEENAQLQELYSTIVKGYHPQMHPEMTRAQKMLYKKAQDAYRRKDLKSLQLISEMLLASQGNIDLGNLLENLLDNAIEQTTQVVKREYSTDYALASTLYTCFVPTTEEAAIQDLLDSCLKETEELNAQIGKIKQEFPFNAAAMLSDAKIQEAYSKELEYRHFEAQKERKRLSEFVQSMIER